MVPYDKIADVAAEIELCRQKNAQQSTEIKASRLIKTKGGKQAIIDLITALGKLGCVPLFHILEKRYCIAGKIVETFLDPMYNTKVANAFIPDSTSKREIANNLYNILPADILNNFALVYRNPSLEEFEKSLHEIVAYLKSHSCIELANLIEGSLPQLKEIVEVECAEPVIGNMQDSINFPGLSGMLMMIEALGRFNLFELVKLVHDEIHAYQDGFQKAFDLLKNAQEGVFTFPNGSVLLFPLQCIPKLEFTASHDNSLIQAADILASSINYLAKCAVQSKSATDLDIELSSLLFPALLNDMPRIAWCVGSDDFFQLLADCYIIPFAKSLPEVEKEPSPKEPIYYKNSPLLPASRVKRDSKKAEKKFFFPTPVYGLHGKKNQSLMIANGLEIKRHSEEVAVIPLFSSKENALDFIRIWESIESFTDEQTVYCYGPQEIGKLIEDLSDVLEYAEIVAFDLGTDKPALMDLHRLILDLISSMNRVARAISSGIFKEIYQLHDFDGGKIMSYLTSDGSYIAAIHPDGTFYKGNTRQEAVEAVKMALMDK